MNLIRDMSSGITLLKLPPYPLGTTCISMITNYLYSSQLNPWAEFGDYTFKTTAISPGDHLYIYDNKLSVLIQT